MNKLRRSRVNKYIGGVCGGLAAWTDTSAFAWRLGFVLVPSSSLVYLGLWILIKKY
jgi:phage shock protein PspC (stress-responsive transcriptional regulator)